MKLYNFTKTVPYEEKQGIFKLFQLIYHNIFDLILTNILFILTSLPIITIPASIFALYRLSVNIVSDSPTCFFYDYFRYFKLYFKQSIKQGFFIMLLQLITAFAFVYYLSLAKSLMLFYLLAFVCFASFLYLLMISFYLFPMLVISDLSFKNAIKNACILSILCAKKSIVMLIIISSVAISTILYFPLTLIIVFLLLFSIISLIICHYSYPAINEYILTKNNTPI